MAEKKFEVGEKVYYVGPDVVTFVRDKEYEILSYDEEMNWYEIYSDVLEDSFLLPENSLKKIGE